MASISALISELANHLWQSTVFAGLAALLTLALRKNHARTRYWLWLIASAKFLLPFSWLVGLGSQLQWHTAALPTARGLSVQTRSLQTLTLAMSQLSQPFAPAHVLNTARLSTALHAPLGADTSTLFSVFLLLLSASGTLAFTFLWWRRWRRVQANLRLASPLLLETAVPVLSSPLLLEPGVFGLFRPVLVLPEGITQRLTRAQLDAVVAHEMCHVRRRDNLTAALHMVVEALFWFHPLVWWLGARLIEERERACDEEVLRLGNEPQVYAEGILKTCEFCLETPLACVSGISGSDLKKRVVRIMSRGLARNLDPRRKLLLAVTGVAVLAGPVLLGLMNTPSGRAQATPAPTGTVAPAFEVASVKLNRSGERGAMIRFAPGGRFNATNVPLKGLLEDAYHLKDSQLVGAPAWIATERYDIQAKAEDSVAEALKKLPPEQVREQLNLMMRALFVDRFKLASHQETRELPVYALVAAKGGAKLKETALTAAELAPPNPDGPPVSGRKGPWINMGRGELKGTAIDLALLSDVLSRQVGRVVLDKTGLKAKYDFVLHWTPDDSQDPMFKGVGPGPDAKPPIEAGLTDVSGPTLFAALQEQLGLKLEAQKSQLDVLVIDRLERPSEN